MSAKRRGTTSKWKWVIIGIVVAVLLVPVGLFLATDHEDKELNEATRAQLGGTYVKLSDGVTHYELLGPKDGPVVVLVHGATIPMWIWDPQIEAFITAGFQLLRYDMYGRGYSDRPDADYNRELYRKQLLDLLDNLGLNEPVDLVGMSLGGAIVTDFTANYPERVQRLVLVAPVVNSVSKDTSIKMLRIPILGDFLMRMVAVKTVTKRANSLIQGMDRADEYSKLLYEQTTYKGFERASLSMFRGDAMRDYREAYRTVGKQNREVMLIWGTEDTDISRERIDEIISAVPNIQVHIIEGVGHQVNLEESEKVNELVVDFLK
ncbi:MAG: alpha/beta hydrolase [Chloroflexi bacterium]|nr:alpha/beta hydrolase [Chloroflexota bacterium]